MNKKYTDYMLSQLRALMAIDSPSGYTKQAREYLKTELKGLGYATEGGHKDGVIANLGGSGAPIMLMSHVDTLGAVVHHIKENGCLQVAPIGGLQPNNTETEHVKVYTRFNGVYEGTLQLENASAHVNPHADILRSFKTNVEVVLDEFVKTAEDTAALGILPGDIVAVNPRFTVTEKGYIKSRYLDDKASAAVLLTLAKYIKDEKIALPRNIWINFTVYEEIGKGGASGIPACIEDILIVDMGCVGENLTCDERMVSICSKDGGGPFNYEMVTALIEAAKTSGARYAVDVYDYYSSDAEVALRAGYDVRHALIGPGVYASHGYERTHIEGLQNTFDLLTTFLMR